MIEVYYLMAAWVIFIAIGASWFQGFNEGKRVGQVLGEDRVRKIYEPFHRKLQDHGEQ